MRHELRFNLNGRPFVVIDVDPETSLAFYLRQTARLTGTKIGCGEGFCGACTVVLGRWEEGKAHYEAVNACVTPLFSVDECFVLTVEGIGSTKKLHAIQERIASGHGTQCGFCSPGFVMSAYALLKNNPNPSKHEILQTVKGNLCRCTGYRPILDALYSFSDGCCQQKTADCPCKNSVHFSDHKLVDFSNFPPLDSSQELIFPPELIEIKQNESLHLRGPRVELFVPADQYELQKHWNQLPQAKIFSSGMISRLEVSKEPKIEASVWISVAKCFRFVDVGEDFLSLGSSLTLTQLLTAVNLHCDSAVSNAFSRLFGQFSSVQIMNLASWSGSILLNRASDFSILADAMDLKYTVFTFDKNEVEMRISDVLKLGSEKFVVKSIKIPRKMNGSIWVDKAGERSGPDLGVVTLAAVQSTNSTRIVMGFLGHSVEATNLAHHIRDADREQRHRALDEDLKKVEVKLGKERDFVRNVARGLVSRMWLKDEEEEEVEMHTEQIFDEGNSGDAVGRPLRHDSAAYSVSGEAIFVGDMDVNDALYLGFVLSSEAHAEFTVDADEALQMPGAVGYFDVKNVTGNNRPGKELFNIICDDSPLFAENVVEFHSQLIGVVAAKDSQTAERAAKLVKVEYRKLPPILTLEEAIVVNSYIGDIDACGEKEEIVEEAIYKAEFTTESQVYIAGQEHMYMEPQTALVIPGEGGFLNIWASTQSQAAIQHQTAAFIGIPANNIIVKTKRLGGAFGGKCSKSILPAAVGALVAFQTGKPVWSVFSRDIDCHIGGKRHPFLVKYKMGFEKSGRLLALSTKMYMDCGYSNDQSLAVASNASHNGDIGYNVPVMRAEAHPMKTNKCSQTAFRGFGTPQACIAMETVLQQISHRTGVPIDVVKEINMSKSGERTLAGAEIKNESMIQCWEEVKQMSNLEKLKTDVENFNRISNDVKRGVGTKTIRYGLTHDLAIEQATALVQIYMDGSVAVSIGGIEMGQGLGTKCRQVCAQTLGVPLENVKLLDTGTDKTGNAPETAGSQGTDMHGRAVMKACERLLDGLEPVMKYKKPWNEMIWDAYMARLPLQATEHIRIDRAELGIGRGMPTYFTCGAAVAVVELDCITGDHRLISVDIVMDVGKSLNPAIDIGQIEGAFIQGYGLITCEDFRWDDEGRIETAGFGKYKIPTAGMCPSVFRVKLLDKNDSYSPVQLYSSKGIGEPPLLLGVSALAALRHAVRSRGIQSNDFNTPLSKRKLLEMLEQK